MKDKYRNHGYERMAIRSVFNIYLEVVLCSCSSHVNVVHL